MTAESIKRIYFLLFWMGIHATVPQGTKLGPCSYLSENEINTTEKDVF